MSFDDDGNVVKMQCLGRAHPKSLHKCGRVSELYVMVITETALAYRLVKYVILVYWVSLEDSVEGGSDSHKWTSLVNY